MVASVFVKVKRTLGHVIGGTPSETTSWTLVRRYEIETPMEIRETVDSDLEISREQPSSLPSVEQLVYTRTLDDWFFVQLQTL